MPELPDIEAYLHALRPRLVDQPITGVRIESPFLVRTVEPPIEAVIGRRVIGLRRVGKRVVLGLEREWFLVFHLMIAGRFRWIDAELGPPAGTVQAGRLPHKSVQTSRLPHNLAEAGRRLPKIALAAFAFPTGTLMITEAGSKKRASLHLECGEAALATHDPGGLEVIQAGAAAFAAALRRENHTLKRALTDPRLIAGIGNAYSDEILHAARLSPTTLTSSLTDEHIARLHEAACAVLARWTRTLCERFERRFPGPGEVTALRDGFAVHGRFGKPCPDCGSAVQRIRYADHETNYCPACQTGGRILKDRSLSRLLKDDWPGTMGG